jgi:hypothetical protein
MGAVIRRIWAEFFIAALVSDQQLAKLVGLQVHHLVQLAERAPEAISYNKGRRMWRLSLCLRHVRRLT